VTLQLVHDANVVALDTPNYGDVPGCLRRLAEEIEADTHGDIFRAVMVLQTDAGIANLKARRMLLGVRAHGPV
jgi:hypothetical protein